VQQQLGQIAQAVYKYLNCSQYSTTCVNHTFFRFGKFGKPLSVVRPTLIRLSDSRALKSSVRPEICVDRQLSRFKSTICNIHKHQHMHYMLCRNGPLSTLPAECLLHGHSFNFVVVPMSGKLFPGPLRATVRPRKHSCGAPQTFP